MEKSFLQSEEWADFQRKLGRNVWQIDGINVIEHVLPKGKTYLYSPRLRPAERGFGGQARFENFLSEVKEIAKKENAIFLKIDLQDQIDLTKYGFIKSNNIQPFKTIILDISKPEQELLDKMHSKMRYNIGLAQKKGIDIKKDKGGFEEFWKLIRQTSKRDGFKPYPRAYYEKMLEIPGIELFLALIPISSGRAMTKVIAANIVLFYGKQAIYLHGATSYEHRNLMAAPLLQWEQIKEAKKRGCTEYDFWGIDEIKWPGVTRFKKGFGGKEIAYPGAYDLIFKPFWYKLYKIAKKFL